MPETNNVAERIRLAKRAGLGAVEFWMWRNKDIGAIAKALADTNHKLTGFVAEPMIALTDQNNRGELIDDLGRSAELARCLGAGTLIAQAGNALDWLSRAA